MSEPKSTTLKNNPFAAGQPAELPVALDDVHKQQLKALKNMSKDDLIMALQAKQMDATRRIFCPSSIHNTLCGKSRH